MDSSLTLTTPQRDPYDLVSGKNPPGKKIPPEKIPLNAVERESVETRVLNPNATEVSYKPKQRSYRKTKLKNIIIIIFFWGGFLVGGILSGNPTMQCRICYISHFFDKQLLTELDFIYDFINVCFNIWYYRGYQLMFIHWNIYSSKYILPI